ncbi:MAG: hypothetical protein ACOY93_06945 [Bacillota bacterium]
MTARFPDTDERTRAVQHEASHRAFAVVGYLILLDIMLYASGYRPAWLDWDGVPLDLWIIMLVGGGVQFAHTLRHRIHSPRQFLFLGGLMLLSAAIAAVIGSMS